MSYTYIASPYSHADAAVREERYKLVCQFVGMLVKATTIVPYSPIAHWHPIALGDDLPKDFEFWKYQDLTMIAHAKDVIVLMLPGWESSKGVTAEIAYAKKQYKPVRYFKPQKMGFDVLQQEVVT